jgi:hypothetical protein
VIILIKVAFHSHSMQLQIDLQTGHNNVAFLPHATHPITFGRRLLHRKPASRSFIQFRHQGRNNAARRRCGCRIAVFGYITGDGGESGAIGEA